MCGIVGLFAKSAEIEASLGEQLAAMLCQMDDRGPDSAGIAVYRNPAPDEAVKLVRARLKPPAPADARKVERLIADLDNEDFEVRQKATDELSALGTEAEDALRKAATSPSPEVRTRVRKLLSKLSAGGVPVTRLRAVRAVEALERIGTPAAREALKGMLKAKTEGAIEQEVRGALARLGER
jgi:HEAT repeat protein